MPFRRLSRALLVLVTIVAFGPVGVLAQTPASGADDDANPLPLLDAPPLTSTTTSPPPTSAAPTPATRSVIGSGQDPTPADPASVTPQSTRADAQAQPESSTAPFYGKARPKKPKLYAPNAKTSPPLPPLVPYRGAPGLPKGQLNPQPAPPNLIDPPRPAPTVAVIQSPDRPRRVPAEDDPFAPTGVAAGSLRLLPFVETSTGFETNPNQTSTSVKASPALRVEGGVDVKSDFSSNSLTASLRGGYTDYPSNGNASRPDASGLVDGRIDVTRDDRIDIEGRFGLTTQTPGSPLLAAPGSAFVTDRAAILTDGATLGGTHAFNRLSLNLRGTFDRTSYGDATQSDGTLLRYSQDNYNDYGVIGKASYELTPAIIPFVELGYDSRVRDNALDLSGYRRSSTGVSTRAGSTFEFSRIFTGTADAGYADRRYADPRLPHLRGPTVDGSLVYAYSPITKVTLGANTTLAETTLAGASGAISRSVSLEIDHIFFRDFTVSGIGTFQVNQYQGVSVDETLTTGTLKAAYNVSRDVQLTASASRQVLNSSLQGSSYTDNIFLVGVRLQR